MFFRDIPGNEEIKDSLLRAIKSNKVPHALLFSGQEGGAGLALAWAFASYLFCENPSQTDACGKCAACSKMAKLVHPDLQMTFPVAGTRTSSANSEERSSSKLLSRDVYPQFRQFAIENPFGILQDWGNKLNSENKQLNIGVEESREIIKNLSMKAFEGNLKIQLLWLAEWMNAPAANALLKILEEPTPGTLFLVVCHTSDKLLVTIQSRLQTIRLSPVDEDKIKTFLIERGFEAEIAEQAAQLSGGIPSKAIALANQETSKFFNSWSNWLRACYSGNINNLHEQAEEFVKLGREGQKNWLTYALAMARETLVFTQNVPDLARIGEVERKFLQGFAKFVKPEFLEPMASMLSEAVYHIERNGSSRLIFMDLSLRFLGGFIKPAK